MQRVPIHLGFTSLLLALTTHGCHQLATPSAGTPQPITMAALHQAGGVPPGWTFTPPAGDVAAGRRAFVDLGCYTCHSVQGEQFPVVSPAEKRPGPDLTGMGNHHPPEYFAESIFNPNAVLVDGPGYIGPDGRSLMPAYPDMTVAQLANLVAYLSSLTTGGDAVVHAHYTKGQPAAGSPSTNEAVVFLVLVNEVTPAQLKAFDAWYAQTGMEDLKNFTGLVSLQTFVNRAVGARQLVMVFGFADESALQDFLTQAHAADSPVEIRALVGRGKGSVFHSSMLYQAPGLSLP